MRKATVWFVVAMAMACSGCAWGGSRVGASAAALSSQSDAGWAAPLSAVPRGAVPPWSHPLPGRLAMRIRGVAPSGVTPPVIGTAQFYHDNLAIYGEGPSGPDVKKIVLTYLEGYTSGIDEPEGTFATINDDWYVTNFGANDVLELQYAASSITPVAEYTAGIDQPSDVYATAKGEVAVSNGIGNVVIFPPGHSSPSETLTVGGAVTGVGIALDSHGNCYWSYEGSSTGAIVEFPGCASGSAVPIVSGLGFPGGVAFDKADNLYYIDQEAQRIYKCTGTSSCKPFGPTGLADPVFLRFDLGWKHLWVADFGASVIYGLATKTGKVISLTDAVGGISDPPLGIAPIPGPKY